MLPTLIGLTVATLFGLLAHGIYGTEQIMQHEWIDIVFWSLIGTGFGVSMIHILGACIPCQLSRRLRIEPLRRVFCGQLHCGH